MLFKDRLQAGELLAQKLKKYQDQAQVVVVGLPRGGVVTAYAVAQELHAPLDVLCLRKIGAPYNPELAVGAVSASGEAYYNESLIEYLGVSQTYLRHKTEEERKLAKARQVYYRKSHPAIPLENQTVILVDDGLATGATMQAAVKVAQAADASHIIVAIPVASPESLSPLESEAEVVCLEAPAGFMAVGQFYGNFDPVEDEEVAALLRQSLEH